MRVLGIETSCDETGVAIYDRRQGLLAHALFSQVALHKEYGGVVPELASRDHVRRLLPLITEVMQRGNTKVEELDGIAYTAGPGLLGALMVGASLAKSMAMVWRIPALGVHHMEGHMLAPMLEKDPPDFPFVALLVSGGHTQLVRVGAIGDYELLGESLDDAVGEAFDKVAKMLELGYPGGPQVAALARGGEEGRYEFPRPMVDRPGLDFSFSGLKTYVRNKIADLDRGQGLAQQDKANIALAFEQAAVDTLVIKSMRALQQTGLKRLLIAGGVSANERLRRQLETKLKRIPGSEVFYARPEFCTDNGAMIAYAGCQRLAAGQTEDRQIICRPRWPMDTLPGL